MTGRSTTKPARRRHDRSHSSYLLELEEARLDPLAPGRRKYFETPATSLIGARLAASSSAIEYSSSQGLHFGTGTIGTSMCRFCLQIDATGTMRHACYGLLIPADEKLNVADATARQRPLVPSFGRRHTAPTSSRPRSDLCPTVARAFSSQSHRRPRTQPRNAATP